MKPTKARKLVMADAQAQADMEQAPGGNVRFAARVLGQLAPPDSRNDIIADKVIVLSFRNLQLSRIGALQDELLELSLVKEPLPPNHADRVDQTLRAYGGFRCFQPPVPCSDPFANIS